MVRGQQNGRPTFFCKVSPLHIIHRGKDCEQVIQQVYVAQAWIFFQILIPSATRHQFVHVWPVTSTSLYHILLLDNPSGKSRLMKPE